MEEEAPGPVSKVHVLIDSVLAGYDMSAQIVRSMHLRSAASLRFEAVEEEAEAEYVLELMHARQRGARAEHALTITRLWEHTMAQSPLLPRCYPPPLQPYYLPVSLTMRQGAAPRGARASSRTRSASSSPSAPDSQTAARELAWPPGSD